MNLPDIPETYDFGFGPLHDLEYLQTLFGISRTRAKNFLRRFGIQPIYVEKKVLFSLVTFQRILFCLMRPGAPGFAFPGVPESSTKKDAKDGTLIKQVPIDILEQAYKPETIAEMAACARTDDALLRKLIPAPRKEKA